MNSSVVQVRKTKIDGYHCGYGCYFLIAREGHCNKFCCSLNEDEYFYRRCDRCVRKEEMMNVN